MRSVGCMRGHMAGERNARGGCEAKVGQSKSSEIMLSKGSTDGKMVVKYLVSLLL